MYCGDETGAFIGDVGSHTSRFGYGGEDNPKYVVPSYVSKGNSIPSSCYQYREDTVPIYRMAKSTTMEPQVDPNAYLQQGDFIEDWDAYEHVWQTSFDVLRVWDTRKHTTGGGATQKAAGGTTSETVRSSLTGEGKCVHPLLVIDSGCTHIMNDADKSMLRKQRMKLMEILMESLEASSIFIAPSPMLAAFSHGRQTCMVVDIGAGGCRVTPVIDGLLLKSAQRRNGRGGDWLGNIQWKALLEEKVHLQPRYKLRNNKASPTLAFHRWAMQDLMYEFRSSDHIGMPQWRMDLTTPFVYDNNVEEMQVDEQAEPSTYELPDGTMVDLTTRVGKDLCRVPELLYTDNVPFDKEEESSLEHPTLSNLPLHKLVHDSLTAVGDADARKELCGNLLLTGGSSLLPNMEQRLSYEMSVITPNMYKCRVLASRNSVERSYAAWIGGSVLTSLGSFQQLWLSRKEYEEYGATLAMQRFP
jgi:actin-related protein